MKTGSIVVNGIADEIVVGRDELNGKPLDEDRFSLRIVSVLPSIFIDRREDVEPFFRRDEKNVQVIGQYGFDVVRRRDPAADRVGFDDAPAGHLGDDFKGFFHWDRSARRNYIGKSVD